MRAKNKKVLGIIFILVFPAVLVGWPIARLLLQAWPNYTVATILNIVLGLGGIVGLFLLPVGIVLLIESSGTKE